MIILIHGGQLLNYNFERIQGPHNSTSLNFEELISQLLAVEMNAEAVDGTGGDKGVDCFLKISESELIVFQAKYFLSRLTASHRRQIKDSLKTVRRNYRLTRWILCIPINPTPNERTWFETLSEDDLALEWWGETKLLALVAKHPDIARTFFREDFLVSEFNTFREEISASLTAWMASRWSPPTRKESDSIAHAYLERAASIGHLLKQDAPLLTPKQDIYVGLDFSELYTYLSSDSRLVASTPIVDFCIKNSPQSLFLPPGAVFELTSFIMRHRNYETLHSAVSQIKRFITAFERDPDSHEAHRAYKEAVYQFNSIDLPVSSNLRKLKSVLETGKIIASSEFSRDLNLDTDDIMSLFNSFNAVRPGRSLANYADALNLAFLKALKNKSNGMVRMISSAPSMARVASTFFREPSLVRNFSEYAYLVHESVRFQEYNSIPLFEANLAEFLDTAKALLKILKREDHERELSKSNPQSVYSLLAAFRSFAPHYRTMLRPVDSMIEGALISLPSIYAHEMRELYDTLKSEADVVSGFKNWWDCVCQELMVVNNILVEQYDSDKIVSEFETLNS